MREILFRGWCPRNEKWIEGDVILNDSRATIRRRSDSMCFRVDPSTISQYTGLKDKNGKRIFEGDILKAVITGDYPIPYREVLKEVVLWDEHDKCFCVREEGNETLVPFSQCVLEDVEIIGNIFDNPEIGGAEG